MVSERSVLRPQSMDEMEQQIMFEMSENLQKQKQSTETIKFQIEKLLQSQAKLIQSQAKLQKSLETMMPRFFEEFHQTQETVTNPDPFVETVKNSDPLIEPLDCSSVLQVLASVPDVLMVDRVDSHVKEVEESSQQSTNGNDKIVAQQLFDQMPQRKAEEEKQQTEALRSELNRMLAELKTMTANREATMSKFLPQASIPLRPPFPPPDPPDMCRFGLVKGFVKECEDASMSGHETNSVLEKETIPSSALCQRVPVTLSQNNNVTQQEELNYDMETMVENGLVQEHESLGLTDSVLKVDCVHSREFSSQFQVPIPSLEPSPRHYKESLVVVNDLSLDLGCVIGKTIGSICDSEIGQDDSLDKEEFVGVVGTEEKLSDRLSLANYVWKPGELMPVQDQWDWISEVHNMGSVLKIMQRFHGLHLQEIISMDMKLREVIVHDVLSVKVFLSVCNRKSEAQLEVYLLEHHNFKIAGGLIYGDVNFHLKHKWRSKVSQSFSELKQGILVSLGKSLGYLMEAHGSKYEGLVCALERKKLRTIENDIDHLKKLLATMEGLAQKISCGLLCGNGKFHLKHKWKSKLIQALSGLQFGVDNIVLITSHVKVAYSVLGLEVFVENVVLFTGPDKLLFSNNHKLLHPEIGFCTQYNHLELLSTEHQSSPGLDYFTYLNFIWKQVLSCGCEAGHISSRIVFVGGVHGLEAQCKRLLVLNEISLLDNDNKVDFTIEASWFYNKPTIREVFHLQRPPELIYLQGNPNFITKVPVQWKEHPPDQFFSGFYGQVLMLSSLRTRMFRRREYCDRINKLWLIWFIYVG